MYLQPERHDYGGGVLLRLMQMILFTPVWKKLELSAESCLLFLLHVALAPWASLSGVFEPANRVNTVKDAMQFF